MKWEVGDKMLILDARSIGNGVQDGGVYTVTLIWRGLPCICPDNNEYLPLIIYPRDMQYVERVNQTEVNGMCEKVTVTKEVADAIEYLRKDDGYSFSDFMQIKTKEQWSVTTQALPLNYISTELLASALINGFEVYEKSPEEKVREYYESPDTAYSEAIGVRITLNLLGIKIKGINE